MRAILAPALVALLAGCAGGGFAGFEPEVTGGGGGLPETRAVARADVVTPPGRRSLGLGVRTYALGPAGEVVEVAGARCAIAAGAFAAELTAPGRLIIPDLGPDAPAVRAACSDGVRRGAGEVLPAYGWAASGGTAVQRIAWGGGWWWGGPRTGPMRYPDLAVGLR